MGIDVGSVYAVCTSDLNDTEFFNVEPKLSFSDKNESESSRYSIESIAKRIVPS